MDMIDMLYQKLLYYQMLASDNHDLLDDKYKNHIISSLAPKATSFDIDITAMHPEAEML
jgi:hypothetical protein